MHPSVQPPDLQQPPARVDPVVEIYFGTTISDPYRWLEASDEPEAQQWLHAQAAYTEAFLDQHTPRRALLERIVALNTASIRVRDARPTRGGRHRWVVERAFAWLGQYRRLSKDYERVCATSEALIYTAMSRLMLRPLARA